MNKTTHSPLRQNRFGLNRLTGRLLGVFLVLCLLAGAGWSFCRGSIRQPPRVLDEFLACPYVDSLYEGPTPAERQPARGLIVPHHLLAHVRIEEAFSRIEPSFSTVIIIGPNHRNAGLGHIQTSPNPWVTRFGTLVTDDNLVTRIGNSFTDGLDDRTISQEHSICGLVSFVKRSFPKVTVVPVILKGNVSAQESRRLAAILADHCRSCLIVASVDFTHESPSDVAETNDMKSAGILERMEDHRIGEVVADSRPTLLTLMEYLKRTGAPEGKLIFQSDSYKISGVSPQSVTSYVSVLY